jgi:hypothetical protein
VLQTSSDGECFGERVLADTAHRRRWLLHGVHGAGPSIPCTPVPAWWLEPVALARLRP